MPAYNKNIFFATLIRLSFLLIAGLFFSQSTIGQNQFSKMESRLPSMPDDTAKVNLLLKLGEHYCSKKNDKALMFLQEAYSIATALDYNLGVGKSLTWQGRVYYYKSEFNLSNNYLDKAIKVLERIDDTEVLSFCYLARAMSYDVSGDYTNAIEMFKKSIALSQQLGNKKRLSSCYMGIGMLLLQRQGGEKALNYFKEALDVNKQSDYKTGIANAYSSIGYYYNSIGLLDSALYYFNQALKIRTALKIDRHIASSEKSIGKTLIEMGRYAEAEQPLKHALAIFEKLDEQTGVVVTNLSLIKAMARQGNPEGLVLANLTLKEAIEIDNPNLLSFVYSNLSDIYAYNNDYQKAFEYQKKHVKLKDSLFTSEKDKMLAVIETKFQTKQKDEKIKYLTEKNKIQHKNNILLFVLIIVFAVSVVLLYFLLRIKSTAFKRQQQLHEQENIINKQEKQIIQQEKQLLQEQLESKNRELASKALEMIRYNDAISGVVDKLDKLNYVLRDNPDAQKSIKEIIREIDANTRQNIWDEFEKVFKNIHSDFYKKLIKICPDISASEIKIAALLKLNLSTKEISAITYKSEGGIKTTRYRLRQKLNLTSDEKLVPFLMQL
jgi:tetratricopeptide (TPR) repeat protein